MIFFNGEEIKLKGIFIYEEFIGELGVVYLDMYVEGFLFVVKDFGVNFVCVVYYFYFCYMVKVVDKMGVLLWLEILVYWNIDW